MPIQERHEHLSRLQQQILYSVLETTVLPRLQEIYDAEYDQTEYVGIFTEELQKTLSRISTISHHYRSH